MNKCVFMSVILENDWQSFLSQKLIQNSEKIFNEIANLNFSNACKFKNTLSLLHQTSDGNCIVYPNLQYLRYVRFHTNIMHLEFQYASDVICINTENMYMFEVQCFHTILLFALIQRSGTCDVYNGLCVSEGRYITHVSVKDPHLNLKNSHDSICLMFNPVVFPQTNDLQTGVNIGRLLFPLSEFVM